MIFLGDIACPHEKAEAFCDCVNSLAQFENETVISNLEGVLLDKNDAIKTESLYNSISVTKAFCKSEKWIVSLANNHMYDYPDKIPETCKVLENYGIGYFGLCEEDGSIKPYEFSDKNGDKFAIFGHCWRVYTETNPNKVNSTRIVDCPYPVFYDVVSDYIGKHPGTKVICFMHWNYDMEKLPFPMLIRLSKDLIDAGAYAVIGDHCHRVQGAEIYKGRVIAYCLGNFYIPSGYFFGGKLNYPDISKESLGIDISGDDLSSLWFSSDKRDCVEFIRRERIDSDPRLKELIPVKTDNIKEYTAFFKRNREKRTLVPVFKDYHNGRSESFACFRIKSIKLLQRILKK